jgi:predicted ribosome quality control (RQC) complex YloA/Tae2 family protein
MKNKIIKYSLMWIALWFSSVTIYASETDSLTYYLRMAAQNNPQVKAAFAGYKASLERIPQAGAYADPELEIGYFLEPMETLMGKQKADLTLMQMFPWFGTQKAARTEASEMARMKYEEFRDSRNNLYYSVKSQWYQLCNLNEQYKNTAANIELLKQLEQLAIRRFSAPGSPAGITVRQPVVSAAQKYYKEYRKLDTAEKKLTVLIAEGEQEVKYLDSVFDSLTRAQTEGDIAELREELFQEGYVKRSKFKGKPPKALPPIRYRSSDGYEIRVGRNNKQNDRLTCKEAEKTDLWLHVKDITGSHVIVTCDGEMPPDRTIEEAAIIAACNSKGRNSSRVDVDYTFIRNVKKPNGSKPGMVIFTNNYTITVKPDTELEEKLRV